MCSWSSGPVTPHTALRFRRGTTLIPASAKRALRHGSYLDAKQAIVSCEHDHIVTRGDNCGTIGLDLGLSLPSLKNDVHLLALLELSDHLSIPERAVAHLHPDHAVLLPVHVERMRDLDPRRHTRERGRRQIRRAEYDLDDVRYLLRWLNITELDEALDIVTRYFDKKSFPPRTRLALEEMLG